MRCDSIYANKNITIKLTTFDTLRDGYFKEMNSILEITATQKNLIRKIVSDSIFSSAQRIKFVDFNNDGFKDILIQNISDVRSNWTYYLYVYIPKQNSFKKINGFEKVKGPKYNSKYNIIESYVVSGKNWIGFYKIVNGKIHDYNITIGNEDFDLKYDRTIRKISKIKI